MLSDNKYVFSFFQSNTLWIYLVLFLFFSALLIVSVSIDSISNYLIYTLTFYTTYLPVLLFAYFRHSIVKRFSTWTTKVIWIFCFLIYPLIIFFGRDGLFSFMFPIDMFKDGLNQIENIRDFRYSILTTITISVLMTEIGILINDNLKDWISQHRFANRISLDNMLIIIFSIIAIFWAVYCTVDIIERDAQENWIFLSIIYLFPYYLLQTCIIVLAYFSFYFLNKNYLIPLFLKQKGVVYYAFAALASLLILYPIYVFILSNLPIVNDMPLEIFSQDSSIFAKDRASIPLLILLLSAPVIVSLQWYQLDNKIVHLEKEKSETELNLLKQQINPHFFFNTLNNLYALSITKDKQTPEVILQLSELMQYVIYKGKEDLVPLHEEIKYIEDYIQLQQIRLHKKLDFTFDKDIINKSQMIPPLLFITFVENAFKHGIEPAQEDCFLHLNLTTQSHQLTFICENSTEGQSTEKRGIGLANLKRRLELRFPNKYDIHLKEDANHYKAMLQLQLA